jgi:hypothetical protein
MAIYSMSSDLQTREIVWVARQRDDAPQDRFAGRINPAPAAWWAKVSGESYASDVVPVTIR